MNTTRREFLTTAGGAALMLAGCSPSGSRARIGSSTPACVLNFGNGAEPSSLDPHHIEGTWESNIVGEMLLGLTTEDPRARPIPGAAERWEVSPDGSRWTFHLRDH